MAGDCLWHCPSPFCIWAFKQTRAVVTFPKAYFWCKSIFQCSSFHDPLFNRETVILNIQKYRSRRHSVEAALAPLAANTWLFIGTAVLTENWFLKTILTSLRADHQNTTYFLCCKEKHLEKPNSLGTKPNAHVLVMCIFSATSGTVASFQLISTSDMRWAIYSVFWDLQSVSIKLRL